MVSVIYPYRDRELDRVRNSFLSLKEQNRSDFEVYFVDYGSVREKAEAAKKLCESFGFNYRYFFTQFQPWNKCRALNSIIRILETDFCFIADVDMVFHPSFIERAFDVMEKNTAVYFQVGFLRPDQSPEEINFDPSIYWKSTHEATGMTMFPVGALKKLRGYDEFYHFWGAEDTDMHVRLKNAGFNVEFFNKEVLMLHQWHPSYRSKEVHKLTPDLQVTGIVQLNHRHLKNAAALKRTLVNRNSWGEIPEVEDFSCLIKTSVDIKLGNAKDEIDELLYGYLPTLKNEKLKFIVEEDPSGKSMTNQVKNILTGKVSKYYTLKEINDKVLLHLISFYREKTYTYRVREDLKGIEVALKL